MVWTFLGDTDTKLCTSPRNMTWFTGPFLAGRDRVGSGNDIRYEEMWLVRLKSTHTRLHSPVMSDLIQWPVYHTAKKILLAYTLCSQNQGRKMSTEHPSSGFYTTSYAHMQLISYYEVANPLACLPGECKGSSWWLIPTDAVSWLSRGQYNLPTHIVSSPD